MIKEIKIEKFEGVAVLVPDDASGFTIRPKELGYVWLEYPDATGCTLNPLKVAEYKIIGKATELTEDQCSEMLTSEEWPMTVRGDVYWCDYNYSDERVTGTARESFDTLMESLECYPTNPYAGIFAPRPPASDKPDLGELVADVIYNDLRGMYLKAEEQTGTWLIIEKVKKEVSGE